jgi:hypothetical protein
MPKPTLGRIVHYRLTEYDVASIQALLTVHRNHAAVGDVCAAVIVRIWDTPGPAMVNLQVLIDGQATYWVTSRCEGDEDGKWSWPLQE